MSNLKIVHVEDRRNGFYRCHVHLKGKYYCVGMIMANGKFCLDYEPNTKLPEDVDTYRMDIYSLLTQVKQDIRSGVLRPSTREIVEWEEKNSLAHQREKLAARKGQPKKCNKADKMRELLAENPDIHYTELMEIVGSSKPHAIHTIQKFQKERMKHEQVV